MNLRDLMEVPVRRNGVLSESCQRIGRLACDALLRELYLTPKPGLVDRRNSGSHRDMDLHTFVCSANAIAGYFPRFVLAGWQYAALPPVEVLQFVRPIGLEAERDMTLATQGVNTHKGGIFALGLLCTAAGRLLGMQVPTAATTLCEDVAAMCSGIVERELANVPTPRTAGEKLFQWHGLTGARGEAASGFATVREHALPTYLELARRGEQEDMALLQTLLLLMKHNKDTNLASRGGPGALAHVQHAAHALLQAGGALHPLGRIRMTELDDDLIARNLSPGGSADLLAVTWFLASFELGWAGEPASPSQGLTGMAS
jgi:triphosphoribosyl-dephospho-CoA synthase